MESNYMLPFTPIEKFIMEPNYNGPGSISPYPPIAVEKPIMEPNEVCDHCMHDLRLECLHMALASVTHADDLEEVLGLAECYFEFVLDE